MVFLSLSLSLSRHCILAPCCGNKNVAHTGLRTKIATTEIVRKYVTGWNREKKKKNKLLAIPIPRTLRSEIGEIDREIDREFVCL